MRDSQKNHTREETQPPHTCTFDCPAEATVAVIGGKWKLLIIYHLIQDTKRFGELRKCLSHVTQQMLTTQLRELEQDGIIHRQIYAQVPPKLSIRLQNWGVVLNLLSCQWSIGANNTWNVCVILLKH